MYQRYAPTSLVEVQIKRMELWEDQFKEWWIGMMENHKWKTEYNSKNKVVSPPFFYADFDADVTRNSNLSGKGVSKNNSTWKNAVARK